MENKLLLDFVQDLRTSSLEKLNPPSYSEWLTRNTLVSGAPMSFAKHHFQVAIINDLHPNMDVIKCSQVGLTEVQYRKALSLAYRNPERTIIFTLPDDDMRKRLVQTRVQPLLSACPIFHPKEGDKPVRSVEVTQINDSFVLFFPCNEKAATSQPADMVLNDEVDLSSQEHLALFNSRMQGSDWKINQRFSTPTFTGFGISATYENSDQHVYMYKCKGCGLQQNPEFTREFCTVPNLPDDIEHLHQLELSMVDKYEINLSNAFMHCKKCHKPMDFTDASIREWVPKHPNRTHHRGYKVTPFCVANIPPDYILRQLLSYKERDFIRGWFNTVLGEAFDGGSNRILLDEIKAAYTPTVAWVPYEDKYAHFIGVDMGATCNIVIGRTLEGDDYETCLFTTCASEDVEHIVCQLSAQYQIFGGHCDRQPYEPTAKAILRATGGLVVPCEYGSGDRYVVKLDVHNDVSHVRVNRTAQLDQVAEDFRMRKIRVSGYGNQQDVINEHLRDMVREEQAEKPATWIKLTGRDHYFHALGYMRQAMRQNYRSAIQGERKGSIIYLGGVSSKHRQQRLLGY